MLENVSVIQGLIATKGLNAKGFFRGIFKKMTKRQRRQTTKRQNDSDDRRQDDKMTKRQLHYSLERL